MSTRKVTVRRVSPLSVFRTSLALSLSGLVAWILCVCIVYFGMNMAGIWTKLNTVIGGAGGSELITFPIVLSAAALLGAMVALSSSILAPLTAMMYNAFVDLFGGVIVTLQDEDE
ncbi:DUF3566 domain-containing protein [Corynebacterium freiburgense]|uniref:DUF3566 domain-containing protein n=1 Tax=Corynebacterium freiburgense TaxID=556548 RepID=UPI00041E35D3|nr:DUF3566 domain-containing protein [Corynebacterium freiburgense]WJZ01330.1 hypothetical protein CFREI_00050 [Corynebacterium freiburgense]